MTEPTKRAVSDFGSPFYLHPSDHPGLNICPVSLKGDNYQEWNDAIRNAFNAKQKLGFIDGTISKPAPTAANLTDWSMNNSMLIGWTMQSIDPTLRSSITYHETVKKLWDDLKQRFSVGNGPRKLQLRAEIATHRQTGQSVSSYYNSLKKLWDELINYSPHRLCTCGNCECNLNKFLTSEREEERIHQFLIGLEDATFSSLRSNILAQESLPNESCIYALAVQEERLKTIVTSRDLPADNLALIP